MRKNSKCAIYSLERIEKENFKPFWKATLVENIYNSEKRLGGNWEFCFYQVNIFSDLPLQAAKFDLEADASNKLSFVNISNPEFSIIRILDFEVVDVTQWKGKLQVKDEFGKKRYKRKFYIHKLELDSSKWKSEESKVKVYEKRLSEIKDKYEKKLDEKQERYRLLYLENVHLKKKLENITLKVDKVRAKRDKTINAVYREKSKVKKLETKLEPEIKPQIIQEQTYVPGETISIKFLDM